MYIKELLRWKKEENRNGIFSWERVRSFFCTLFLLYFAWRLRKSECGRREWEKVVGGGVMSRWNEEERESPKKWKPLGKRDEEWYQKFLLIKKFSLINVTVPDTWKPWRIPAQDYSLIPNHVPNIFESDFHCFTFVCINSKTSIFTINSRRQN